MAAIAPEVLTPAEPGPAASLRLQAAVWSFLGLLYLLVLLPQSAVAAPVLIAFKASWAVSGAVVSSVLGAAYRAARIPDRPAPAALILALPLSAGAAIAWVLGVGAVADRVAGVPHLLYTRSSLPFVFLNHYLILLAWSGAWVGLRYRQRSEADARRALAALGQARTAQLEMLRYQLNPHFLFNALNAVRALVLEDPARARAVVGRLSDFLRYALAERRGDSVAVREEIAIVRDYLDIEAVRFEEQLDAAVALDPAAADLEMPVFLLHSLVENAVKHGEPRDGRLVVRVTADRVGRSLRLAVENSGTLVGPEDDNRRIGLDNVRRRLEAGYPGRHRFTLAGGEGVVRATVVLDPDRGDSRA